MNFDLIEGLNESEITQLYDNTVEIDNEYITGNCACCNTQTIDECITYWYANYRGTDFTCYSMDSGKTYLSGCGHTVWCSIDSQRRCADGLHWCDRFCRGIGYRYGW